MLLVPSVGTENQSRGYLIPAALGHDARAVAVDDIATAAGFNEHGGSRQRHLQVFSASDGDVTATLRDNVTPTLGHDGPTDGEKVSSSAVFVITATLSNNVTATLGDYVAPTLRDDVTGTLGDNIAAALGNDAAGTPVKQILDRAEDDPRVVVADEQSIGVADQVAAFVVVEVAVVAIRAIRGEHGQRSGHVVKHPGAVVSGAVERD